MRQAAENVNCTQQINNYQFTNANSINVFSLFLALLLSMTCTSTPYEP